MKGMLRRAGVALMALIGMGAARATAREATPQVREVVYPNTAGTPMPGHGGALRLLGHTPKDWGMSAACARMVRKNRLHAHGLSHARI